MQISFTAQEYQFLQSIMNEMYQTDLLRSGPMGDVIIGLRNKFVAPQPITLTDSEVRFLLLVVQDVFNTSRSPVVQSQFGITMKFQSPMPYDDYHQSQTQIRSSISQMSTRFQNDSFSDSSLQGSYLTMWQVMTNIMTKLGLQPPPAYKQPAVGPTGDPGAISTKRPNVDPDDRIIKGSEGS